MAEDEKAYRFADYLFRRFSSGVLSLISYKGTDEDVAIPASVGGLPVVSIAAGAFRGNSSLRALIVPDSVQYIGNHAFDSCDRLRQVTLPESLAGIGFFAFAKTALERVDFPSSLRFIRRRAFYYCTHLTRVSFGDALREIGDAAFAHTAVESVLLPRSLSSFGNGVFELAPLLKGLGSHSLAFEPGSAFDVDEAGGLYCGNDFVELLVDAPSYSLRFGTRRICSNAFRYLTDLQRVDVPEGLVHIGDSAFHGCSRLKHIVMPSSLEYLGEKALLGTAVRSLSLSARLDYIGEGALLVQGENYMTSRPSWHRFHLDEANKRFYIQNSLLCERDGDDAGGDACLLYVGPDKVVSIPNRVTKIASMAFGGVDGIEELYVHGHLRSICNGAFSSATAIPLIHVSFDQPVDGYESYDFRVPKRPVRMRSLSRLLLACEEGTYFDFDYYDAWVAHAFDIEDFAPAALARLRNPLRLSSYSRQSYRAMFECRNEKPCCYFADLGDMEALRFLYDEGLITVQLIERALSVAMSGGKSQAVACLLELKHRIAPKSALDFSL